MGDTESLGDVAASYCILVNSLPGLVEEWLRRSGVLPLTVFCVQFDYYSRQSEMEVTTHRIIALLTLHSSRWRNLYLDVGADIPVRLRLFCFHGSQSTPPADSKWWNITRSEIQHGAQGLPYVFRAQEISPDVGRYWLGQHHTCNSLTSERQRVRRGVTTTPALEYCYVSEFTKSSSDYNLERPLSIRDCTRRVSRRRCNRIPKDLSKNVVLSLEEWTRNEGWMRVGIITGDNHGISSPALNLKLLPQIVELVVLRMLTQSGSGDVMDEILFEYSIRLLIRAGVL